MSKVEFKRSKGIIKKIILLLCLFLSGFYNSADEPKEPLITNIWLVKSKTYSTLAVPAVLPIGININRRAYYKITDTRETIVKGGLLNKGSNIIELNAENFFKQSHSLHYILALKIADRVFKKKINIDVKLDSPTEKEKKVTGERENTNIKVKPADEKAAPENSMSVSIKNRFILEEKISHCAQVQLRNPNLLKENYGQPSHIDGSYPALTGGGIPVLPLAAMLLKKVFFKKSKNKKKSLPEPRDLAVKFLRNEPGGKEEVVTAKISIKISPF